MTTATQTPRLADDAQRGSHSLQRLVGRHGLTATLYNADCLDVLPLACDAVVTDPPYGLEDTMQSGGNWWGKRVNGSNSRKTIMAWDKGDMKNIATSLLELAPIVVIWGGNYFVLPPSRGWLVWHKPDAVPTMANAELAWTNLNQNTRQISWSIAATNAERVGHPTQKPVRVMAWSMDEAGVPKGATVLDPYMGSGSTGIACLRTGRNFIGIERDAAHYKTACDRIAHELDGALL